MSNSAIFAIVAALLLVGNVSGAPRALLQSAAPPNPSFGGPPLQLDSSVLPPGTTTKINWHAVGTHNYSSASNSQYVANGAVANFFLQNGTNVVGKLFFVKNADGSLTPTFTRNDAQGNLLGTVTGVAIANSSAPAYNDDGGFGSVPTILFKATFADGFFAGVTYVVRTNTLGGTVPGNPKLFTLPASPTGIPNFNLAIPFQADYFFLVPGSPPAAG